MPVQARVAPAAVGGALSETAAEGAEDAKARARTAGATGAWPWVRAANTTVGATTASTASSAETKEAEDETGARGVGQQT